MSRFTVSPMGLGVVVLAITAITAIGAMTRRPASAAGVVHHPVALVRRSVPVHYAATSPTDTDWAIAAHLGW
jgi:hypothetical protein